MKRLNININDETVAILEREREKSGVSATETTRRAFAIFDYIFTEARKGNRIFVEDRNGKSVELVFLP